MWENLLTPFFCETAAKAALRRKKAHEHSLEQTQAQIGTLEQQVNAIESANINRETLAAMERAATAMKQIHGGLTPEKVDETMERIQEQNQLSEEIVNAITSNSMGEQVDDADLEEELDKLQQEQLDERMLETGPVPVSDAVHQLPAAANGEREFSLPPFSVSVYPFRAPFTVLTKIVKSAPVEEEDDEEAELRKLQAEMAM